MIKTKSLVKSMIKHELIEYCLKHPKWKIPTASEAQELDIDSIDWDVFRVDEELDNQELIYNKRNQCFRTTHPLFKHRVVLVEKESK